MARRTAAPAAKPGLFRTAERLGINRGLFGGSKGWFYVGTGLWTLRTVRRLAARNVEVLLSEEIKPGQRIVIANGRATLDEVAAPVQAAVRTARRARRRS